MTRFEYETRLAQARFADDANDAPDALLQIIHNTAQRMQFGIASKHLRVQSLDAPQARSEPAAPAPAKNRTAKTTAPRNVQTAAAPVVLAAGVFHSPQLLLLSGVGPAAELDRLGVPVRVDLPGVGENYRDHTTIYMTFEGTPQMAEDYVIPKVRLLYKSASELPCADFHVFFRPAVRVSGLPPMMPVSLHLLDDRTPGRVGLASLDPLEDPLIQPALLKDPADVDAVLRTMRFITELVAHPALAPFYGPLIQPGPGEDWEEFIQSTFGVYWHGVGTCRFGLDGDALAVVTPELRVRGLANLWVADASVVTSVVGWMLFIGSQGTEHGWPPPVPELTSR